MFNLLFVHYYLSLFGFTLIKESLDELGNEIAPDPDSDSILGNEAENEIDLVCALPTLLFVPPFDLYFVFVFFHLYQSAPPPDEPQIDPNDLTNDSAWSSADTEVSLRQGQRLHCRLLCLIKYFAISLITLCSTVELWYCAAVT